MKTKLLLFSLALLLAPLIGYTTHINGSYISYTVDPQNPLKYNFRLTLSDNDESPAEDTHAQISMGDSKTVTIDRTKVTPYLNRNSLSVFDWEYTYQQPGDYVVSWNGINRNGGIVNVSQPTDMLSQFIHTKVQSRLVRQNNHSVRTIVPAPFEAFIGELFKMNAIAYDADGDKLFYELIPSQYLNAQGIPNDLPGYHIPTGMSINQAGELKWENPTMKGEYALSIKITEYRNQLPVGYTVVDLNLKVRERGQERGYTSWIKPNFLHPRVRLVNQNRLTYDGNGLVRAKADQPLKLEFYVEKAPNTTSSSLSARQFSDVDTLDVITPSLITRDSADGLAVTVLLNTNANLAPSRIYTIGLRGATFLADYTPTGGEKIYDYGWDFVSFYYGELQLPTGTEDDMEKHARLIYPNPVQQEFVVEAKGPSTLHLYTVEGKKVYQLRLTSGSNKLTRPTHLAPGLYTYQIINQANQVNKGKLLLQ